MTDDQITGAWKDKDMLVLLIRDQTLVVMRHDWTSPSDQDVVEAATDLFPQGAPFKIWRVEKPGSAPLALARSLGAAA